MCLEDVAISRRSYTKATVVAAGSTTTFLANLERIAMTFKVSGLTGCSMYVSDVSTDPGFQFGFLIYRNVIAGGSDMRYVADPKITYLTHPGIIHGRISVGAIGEQVMVLETLLMPEIAANVDRLLASKGMGRPMARV